MKYDNFSYEKNIKGISDIKENQTVNAGMIYSFELWLSSILKSYKIDMKGM